MANAQDEEQKRRLIERITMPLLDLRCPADDPLQIERILRDVTGVRHVYVSAATEMIYVEYDANQCAPGIFKEVLALAGFKVGEAARR